MSEIDRDRVKINHNDSLPLNTNNQRTPIASKDCEDQKPPFTDSKNVKAQPKESCVGDSLDTEINSNSVRLSPEDNVRRAIRVISLWPEGKEQDMRDFLSSD